MKLSIIIPCYNEEKTIKDLLKNLFEIHFPIEREIIVIDDGSRRNLKEIISKEITSKKIQFIRLPQNQGKGVAIRIGLKYASGDIFIIQDADFEYFPSDIPKLLNPILKNQFNVVYGTRFATRPKLMSRTHYLANKYLTKITNFLYHTNLTDMETGYKLFTRKVLNSITLKTREFEFEPEITAKIILSGFRICELPITYKYRHFGFAKINWLDGVEGALVLLQNRYFSNSKLYQFLYKIFKFHVKRIILKLTRWIAKFIYLRRV
ncbi:MAG: glycosyltransferase family 2 protein [Promethearchaeota archaeon]